MAFSLIQAAAGFFAIISVALASKYFSLRSIMITRLPVLVLFLSLLVSNKSYTVPLFILAILQGFQFVLYYLPLHVFFTNSSDEQSVGRQLGLLGAIPKFVCLGAPVLAGFIAVRFGFLALFGLAAAIYALSAFVMLRLPPYKSSFSLNRDNFSHLYRKYRTYFWLEVVENIQEELDLVIWPIVVYLTLHSTLQTGAASTVISVTAAAFTYIIGRVADKFDKFWLLRLGGIGMLLLWLWRLMPLNILEVFIISALVGLVGVMIDIPFDSIIYNLARTNDPRHFIIFREIPIGIARFAVYIIAVLVATDLKHLFWFAIAAYTIFAFIPRFDLPAHISTSTSD